MLLILSWQCFAVAQQSNLVKKRIATKNGIIDEKSIVPKSFFIEGFDTSFYAINYATAELIFKKNITKDSINIQYRTFAINISTPTYVNNFKDIANNFSIQKRANNIAANSSVFNFGNLQYNGSFGRNLSFGNSQSAVFNSQFNLQLSGYIGDSIQLSAAITDDNIPIQPDGTTQQLNEFDKILLQFRKNSWELNIGDLDLRVNDGYFIQFYKRLQGINYRQKFAIGKKATNTSFVNASIAKGKFSRNIFNGLEGNQGPYRLTGNNGELFLLLLANTEKVFIDGEKMQRGEDQDYVINYNTAEITFTPKRMITKDKRIQVEFEYADRNYLNSFLYAANTLEFGKKLKVHVAAFSNADSKSSPINQTLDNAQKAFLGNIGDSIQNAFYQIATIDSFNTNKILYKKIQHPLITNDSIFVYSTNKDSARFRLNFILVGENKGNYQPLFNGANGLVFQWVAPIANVPQGSYEPATFLITPKVQQSASIGIDYALNTSTTLQSEMAVSNYNINTFSTKDKQNDVDAAGKIVVANKQMLQQNKQLQLLTKLSYEWVGKQFTTIERLRTVEFYRDWGLALQPTNQVKESIPKIGFQLTDKYNNNFVLNLEQYTRGDGYKGLRNTIQNQHQLKHLSINSQFAYTQFTYNGVKGFFLKPTLQLTQNLPKLYNYQIGTSYALEHNQLKNTITDSLSAQSFSFYTIAAFIKSNPSLYNRWAFTYFSRSDKLPYLNTLAQVDRSHNYQIQIDLTKNQKHQWRLNATYRNLQVANTKIATAKADNSLLGRVEYLVREWNGFVTGAALYELGAGQEQQRNISYIEVPAGRGEYTWIDYNADGIPQLNEFEIAQFQDQAKYIRIFTSTNQYIKTNYTQFNYNLSLNPRSLFKNNPSSSITKFVQKLNVNSSLQANQKLLANDGPTFNPFSGKVNDTALVQANFITNNTLSFNRFSSIWGVDVTHTASTNKALLTYGTETRKNNTFLLKGRYNITQEIGLELVQKNGKNILSTPSFSNRNYAIRYFSVEPKLAYTYQTIFRLAASYIYSKKQNEPRFGTETSTSHQLILDAKYNAVQSTSLSAKFTFNNLQYNADANNTIGFFMLDGLSIGKNFLWNIDLTKRLINNLELTFQYEGRKPGNTNTIHVGRASVRALL